MSDAIEDEEANWFRDLNQGDDLSSVYAMRAVNRPATMFLGRAYSCRPVKAVITVGEINLDALVQEQWMMRRGAKSAR